VVMFPLIPSNYSARIASLSNLEKDDSLHRRGLYVVFGTDILIRHPFAGIGPGAFPIMIDTEYKMRFPLHLRRDMGDDDTTGRAAHNMYMEMAAETGLPGLLLFGALLLVTWREMRRLVRHFEEKGPAEFLTLARSLEVGYLSFLVTSLFLSAEYDKYLWFLFAMPVALTHVTGAWPERAPDPRDVARPRKRALPAAADTGAAGHD